MSLTLNLILPQKIPINTKNIQKLINSDLKLGMFVFFFIKYYSLTRNQVSHLPSPFRYN